MPFPASQLKSELALVLANIGQVATATRNLALSASARAAAGSALATEVLDLDIRLRRYRAELVTAAAVDGIREYAAAQSAFAGLDVVAEWNTMIGAIDNVTAWIRANFPTSTVGGVTYLLRDTWGEAGPESRSFTAAQLAPLRTRLDALAATVS